MTSGIAESEFAFIVLAAGESTRFGENKLLYKIEGRSIIRRVVQECSLENFKTVVVIGHEKDRIIRELEGLNVFFVINPEYKNGGMSSSIRIGVSSVKPSKAYLITPGDMPYLQRWICEKIIDFYMKSGAKIVVPSYEGKGGHPILFDASLREELLAINEATKGLKGILSKHTNDVSKFEIGTSRVLIDIDYKKDIDTRKPVDRFLT
ncbi:MAG: nucleotidyltransferase family protein [Conexivisphaerales archaeon]|nr:nucleotidyltransferase family protein [Conexivisphaerales archaeon]